MQKKQAFKQIISDFITRPLGLVVKRDVEIPIDLDKIVSLIGPRRSGKTHLLYQLIGEQRQTIPNERLVYINFEDDRLFPLKLEDMDELLQAYYEMYPLNRTETVWFFFDEVQEVPNWEKFVRRVFDTENCRIYITGSSSKLLSRELATTLRGRTLPIEVFPLSFTEFIKFNQIEAPNPNSSDGNATALHWFDKWLKQGGFPELVFLNETLHRPTINEYLDLMLFRDLTERFSLKQPAMLKYLLRYFLQNVANQTSITKVHHDLKSQGYSVSKNTVFDYLSHLEEAFALFHTGIWSHSVRQQAVNPSKYYCIDPAFKYAFSNQVDDGRMLENAVFLHLRRQGKTVHYWQGKQEVDFYWQDGVPMNVCYAFDLPSTRNREVKGMLEALTALDLSFGIIITRDLEETIQEADKVIHVVTAWKWMSGLSEIN
jgi:uncharacterized protein